MLEIGFDEFVLDFFLPFILFFSIIYILLLQLRIFGDPTTSSARKTNLVIALSISILVVLVNPFGISFKTFLSQLFSGTLIIVLGLIFLIFFSAMISLAGGLPRTSWVSLLVGLGLVILAFSATHIWQYLPLPVVALRELDIGIIVVIVIVVIIFGVIWWLMRSPTSTRV